MVLYRRFQSSISNKINDLYLILCNKEATDKETIHTATGDNTGDNTRVFTAF